MGAHRRPRRPAGHPRPARHGSRRAARRGHAPGGCPGGRDLPGESHHHTTAVRALQLVLAGIAGVAVVRGETTLVVNSAGPLAITFLPAVFRREHDYALARSVEGHTRVVIFTPAFRSVFVVLFVLAVGVGWEILEFASGGVASLLGGEAVLAQYGTTDIVNDLVFKTLGAVPVAVRASTHFDGVADRLVGSVGE